MPRIDIVEPYWTNVAEEAVAYIPSPLNSWANPDDCGDWPCTALQNVVVRVFRSDGIAGTDQPGSVIWNKLKNYNQFHIVSAPSNYVGKET